MARQVGANGNRIHTHGKLLKHDYLYIGPILY